MGLPVAVPIRVITTGTQLAPGQQYSSFAIGGDEDAPVATLTFQEDGNLVVYDEQGTARWGSHTASTETPDHGATSAFGSQGSLVVYDSRGGVAWSSRTEGHPHALLFVQNDGNVVIYDPYPTPIWAANTEHTPLPAAGEGRSGDNRPGGRIPLS